MFLILINHLIAHLPKLVIWDSSWGCDFMGYFCPTHCDRAPRLRRNINIISITICQYVCVYMYMYIICVVHNICMVIITVNSMMYHIMILVYKNQLDGMLFYDIMLYQ